MNPGNRKDVDLYNLYLTNHYRDDSVVKYYVAVSAFKAFFTEMLVA